MRTKKYWMFLFLVFSGNCVYADLKVSFWEQKNIFNDRGQEIAINMKLKAEGLLPNHYYDGWSMLFDKKSKISILEARAVDSDYFEHFFGGNELKFKFRKLFNSKEVSINFKYQLDNDEIAKTPYLRRETVNIPRFVSGAAAKLEVHVLSDMTLYSLNYLFDKNDDIYRWEGVVGKNGFKDTFAMTRNEATWKVSTVIDITDETGIGNLVVQFPLDYVGGNNEIIKYNISNGQEEYMGDDFLGKNESKAEVKFRNFSSKKSFIRIDVLLKNNYDNFHWINNFDFSSTTKLNEEYLEPYSSLVNRIDSEYSELRLPIYIKIAKWVYENMTYDEKFVGKKMTSMEILKTKIGVCEHYAILYQDLVRSINIPSKTISGLSYNFDKKQFESHAWVMIYDNNKWIPIDPTWGIFSGRLPISHIFLYNDIGTTTYSRRGSLDSLRFDTKHDAEFIE
ncbi:hypothetical protein FACS1894152_3840 [Bacilli bacterium]|nr:hypothetical protein FACS1894152_3840 [Bacilli bacterium]